MSKLIISVATVGTRPFESATVPVRLLESKAFDSVVTLLRYEPLPESP
jgi:hypothetical protein